MARLRDLLVELPWHRLAPDENHEFVTDGYGQGVDTALTARTADKRLSVTYVPSTGTASRQSAANLVQFPGPVTARWYNPVDGRWTSTADAPLPNRNSFALYTPGDNGTRTNDRLLVSEVR